MFIHRILLTAAFTLVMACVATDDVALDEASEAITAGSAAPSPTATAAPSPTSSPSPSPSPTASPSPSPSPSPTASPSPSPSPTPACTPQPEPACPAAPAGYQPVNPGIPSGGQCRGACGADCPASCRPGTPATACLEWQTADCQWHAKVCTYPVRECGSHQGCRDHDACYDRCAPGLLGAFCRRICDEQAVARWGVNNCTSWWGGGGPYDQWLSFADTPTSYTYDSTCY